MTTMLKLIAVSFIMLPALFAQSANTYNYQSSDGTYVYATAGIQSDGWYGYDTFTHDYQVWEDITSPSGRRTSCFYEEPWVPAPQPIFDECNSQLPVSPDGVNFEEGDYSVDGGQSATCSQVGQFVNVPFSIPIKIWLAQTYFKGGYPTAFGCFYPETACSSGTPTCSGGWTLSFEFGCPEFASSKFIVYQIGSGPNANPPICTKAGFTAAATGPGPCY